MPLLLTRGVAAAVHNAAHTLIWHATISISGVAVDARSDYFALALKFTW
jgi:hypothetical protein